MLRQKNVLQKECSTGRMFHWENAQPEEFYVGRLFGRKNVPMVKAFLLNVKCLGVNIWDLRVNMAVDSAVPISHRRSSFASSLGLLVLRPPVIPAR